jgi:hypothetical protein
VKDAEVALAAVPRVFRSASSGGSLAQGGSPGGIGVGGWGDVNDVVAGPEATIAASAGIHSAAPRRASVQVSARV